MGGGGLSVGMESAPPPPHTPYAAFLHPVMLHIKLIKTGQLASEIFKFESVDDDGRATDHWHTISSPFEPSAQMS